MSKIREYLGRNAGVPNWVFWGLLVVLWLTAGINVYRDIQEYIQAKRLEACADRAVKSAKVTSCEIAENTIAVVYPKERR